MPEIEALILASVKSDNPLCNLIRSLPVALLPLVPMCQTYHTFFQLSALKYVKILSGNTQPDRCSFYCHGTIEDFPYDSLHIFVRESSHLLLQNEE